MPTSAEAPRSGSIHPVKLAIPREAAPGELRCAVTPDSVKRLAALGLSVAVEAGAGAGAGAGDAALAEAGATIVDDPRALLADARIVCRVQPPSEAEAEALPLDVLLVSFLPASTPRPVIERLRQRRASCFSFELVPRISRAQAMDALSSQASIAGYKAVLLAAARLPKILPLQMTAAGTIAPARVLVMGAGVAGLQAIATARRLGAVVEATDVRTAAREEVTSLGARFVELELEAQEGAGGYARAQSEEFLKRQRALVAERVAASDVVVTTAAIPGRRAPVLVTEAMVRSMRPGSVIVDGAADTGGNCELTVIGEEVDRHGVTIIGRRNLPATVPAAASQVFARNVAEVLQHLVHDGALVLDLDDPVTGPSLAIHAGEVRSPQMQAPPG